MNTLLFSLVCIGIIALGGLVGLVSGIIANKQKKNIPESFCEDNTIYYKFTDQNETSIDEIVTNFKLLDF